MAIYCNKWGRWKPRNEGWVLISYKLWTWRCRTHRTHQNTEGFWFLLDLALRVSHIYVCVLLLFVPNWRYQVDPVSRWPWNMWYASSMMIRQSMFSSRAKALKGIKYCVTGSIRRPSSSFPRPSSSLQAPRTVRHSCCFSKPVLCMRRVRLGNCGGTISSQFQVTRWSPQWRSRERPVKRSRFQHPKSSLGGSFHFWPWDFCLFSSLPYCNRILEGFTPEHNR